ncbi:MAG: chlorhexidine efflux PACE transporter AceI [Acinetobacter sp.]|jgi:uncharacterized membrane protein|nr:MAG: chlorhexidine efflux PACE transporter AceI [Acinetobacter sp.]
MQVSQQLKHRIIHALCYEFILLLIGTPLLSLFLQQSLADTGILWVMMSVTAVFWNMCFNYFFEKIEHRQGWTQRTIPIRIVHALGFEGGLLIFTVPMIAWMMGLSMWQALWLDIGLVFAIVGYTFVYQWCYDIIYAKYVKPV